MLPDNLPKRATSSCLVVLGTVVAFLNLTQPDNPFLALNLAISALLVLVGSRGLLADRSEEVRKVLALASYAAMALIAGILVLEVLAS